MNQELLKVLMKKHGGKQISGSYELTLKWSGFDNKDVELF